jgi:cell division protein FtsB
MSYSGFDKIPGVCRGFFCVYVNNLQRLTFVVAMDLYHMKPGRVLITILTNRYLLAITAFAVWITFFDENNLFVQHRRTRELSDLKSKIDYYHNQVNLTKKELDDLKNDPAALEKYAREKYFMKRDNEEVYIIDTDSISYQQ